MSVESQLTKDNTLESEYTFVGIVRGRFTIFPPASQPSLPKFSLSVREQTKTWGFVPDVRCVYHPYGSECQSLNEDQRLSETIADPSGK